MATNGDANNKYARLQQLEIAISHVKQESLKITALMKERDELVCDLGINPQEYTKHLESLASADSDLKNGHLERALRIAEAAEGYFREIDDCESVCEAVRIQGAYWEAKLRKGE